jgi:hypothetical protein
MGFGGGRGTLCFGRVTVTWYSGRGRRVSRGTP